MLRYLQTIDMQFPYSLEVHMARMQVLNTRGAAKRLGCSQTWIHRLVSTGKLKAYIYDDNGRLVERKPQEKRQGQAMAFLLEDIDTYQPAVQRRPRGSKNKLPRLHEQHVPTA
jgi:predicted DNA-binding transcriptional regulator AlpA